LNQARAQRMIVVRVRFTTLNIRLLELFVRLGIVRGFHSLVNNEIEVLLKINAFRKITLVSKPSLKVYLNKVRFAKAKERSMTTFFVLSTSKGLVLDSNCFISNIYGKVLLKIEI
jgi:ribosomal protein S8